VTIFSICSCADENVSSGLLDFAYAALTRGSFPGGWVLATPLYQLEPLRVPPICLKSLESHGYALVAMEPDPDPFSL